MSEPIPESIPQSQAARRLRPPPKAARPATATPTAQQASLVASLFSHPEREIHLPPPLSTTTTFSSSSQSATALTTTSSSSSKPGLPPPPEIVANVQGSSAGAGSGEFHVYKASRRREYERVRLMEEEVRREEADRGFFEKREELGRREGEKRERRKKRREKRRGRKGGGEKGSGGEDRAPGGEAGECGGEEMEVVGMVGEVQGAGVVICDDD